ncbi:catalase family peroxidase [Pseudomonas sp. SZMC_28357]|uniref:catalase family peroxidase n=1 Tax=Pseudomonas sp. SZMC_28357 TaxID=3074380 RepID=UPI0028728225|nr:catalase family peroxidase [Pseudomonas sp. SZMC_28357]MDR9753775.1 catalase family peroxidase [Pseudomonas sp. SZMC_28357]
MSTLQETTPVELIDALNSVFGKHKAARGSHAKGLCANGEFIPAADAPRWVASSLFAQGNVPAVLRFSVGGGNPNVSDKSRTVRGLSLRLKNATETYDLLMISEPVFFAATPASFVAFLQARVADPETKKPNPDNVKAYEARFPDGKLQPQLLAAHPAPASYATTAYFSTHAFRFVNANGEGLWGRLVMQPLAGTVFLSSEQEAALPDTFLTDELGTRLQGDGANFALFIQPAGPDDSLVDPSQLWGDNGSAPIELGRLNVQQITPDIDCDRGVFDPLRLPTGIEPSDDPVLKARSAAYSVSLERRQ